VNKRALFLAVSAIGLIVPLAPAFAQSEDPGDIIVTARKRQESILKVPVVETVLTQQTLERVVVKDLVDVSKLTPGLVLGLNTNEIGTQVSIRGIGTTSLDPGIDQSVLLNIDGLSLSQGLAYSVGIFDMQQVEVLKGPQALFFGKNSPAGVISIRTNDPGDEAEVIGRTGYEFEGKEWRNELILSGPVTDTLGLRLAAMYSDYGGFFKNTGVAKPNTGAVQLPKRFGETKTLFLRGTALFQPVPEFTARLKLNYTRDRNKGGAGFQLTSCPDGLVNYLANSPIPFYQTIGNLTGGFYSPNETCKKDRKVNIVGMSPTAFTGSGPLEKGGTPFTDITQYFGTLELDYNISPDVTLTSVSGYYKVKTDTLLNCFFSGSAAPGCAADKNFRRREFTQELRLNTDFNSPFNFTAGGFYQNGRIYAPEQLLTANTRYFLPPLFIKGSQDVHIKSKSVFAQGRFKPDSKLEIAAGVRYTDEKRRSNPTYVVLFDTLGNFLPEAARTTLDVTQPKLRSKNWSPELTITYTPTDDLTIFGSLKQGYKSGSYNIVIPVPPGPNQDKSFGDEKSQGGEIGLKTRLADRQLNLNAAAYWYKYTGLQVGINTPSLGGPPNLSTINAGAAKIYGLDLDMSFRPRSVDGLEITASFNYNHGRFTSFKNAPCAGGQSFAQGCNLLLAPIPANDPYSNVSFPAPGTGVPSRYTSQDLSGARLSRSPDFAATLGINYEMPAGNDMKLNLGASGQYSSKYSTNVTFDPAYLQRAFVKFNANVSLKGPNEGWEVGLVGNNLFNKLTTGTCLAGDYAGSVGVFGNTDVSGAPTAGPSGSDEVFCAVDRGRELWIRLTLRPTALFGR
jgi:outer membrane receptor protein involved in Fe transport